MISRARHEFSDGQHVKLERLFKRAGKGSNGTSGALSPAKADSKRAAMLPTGSSAPVVVAAGGDANFINDHLVHEPMLIGDPA